MKNYEAMLNKRDMKFSAMAPRSWKIWQVIDLLSTMFQKISAFLLLLIIIAIWYQIGARVAHFSISGMTEFGGYLLIWITWFAIASNLKKNRHIKVDLMVRKMSGRVQAFFSIISNIMCLIFSVIMVIASLKIVNMYFVIGEKSSFLNIPIFIVFTALPAGLFLFGLAALKEIVFTLPLCLTKPQQKLEKENC